MSDYQTTRGNNLGIQTEYKYGPSHSKTLGIYELNAYGPALAAEVGVDSRNTTYIRILTATQRPSTNILDVSGLIYDDQGLVMTLKKVQYGPSESGPWTDGTILSADPGYNFPPGAVPAGTPYNVPVDILGAASGDKWFRIEMDYDSTTTEHVQGPFPFTAFAPVPGLPDFLTVPETSRTGDYRIEWGAGILTDYYELEEATNEDFTDAHLVATGVVFEYEVTDKPDGEYYYRVRGVNAFNVGPWLVGDNPVQVLPPEPPSLLTVPEQSTTGAYRISWTPSEAAEWYEVQEDKNQSFPNPTQIYRGEGLFVDVTGRTDGRYYYRVRAGRG